MISHYSSKVILFNGKKSYLFYFTLTFDIMFNDRSVFLLISTNIDCQIDNYYNNIMNATNRYTIAAAPDQNCSFFQNIIQLCNEKT